MTRTMSHILLLAGKDLKIQARTRHTFGLIAVLGVLIVVVLGLGLGAQAEVRGFSATAVLWVAYLFSGVLCFEKTMAVERNDDALAGLLLAQIDRSLIYVSKLVTNLALMAAVALVVTPVGVLFFSFDLSAAPGTFVAIIAISMVGFAAVGTLFAAVVSSSRLQGGLLAMMVFPITLPLVIVSTRLMTAVFRDGQAVEASNVGVLVAFDAIFLAVSWVVFEWVLEV
jgi:heme exporter protein B